MTGAARGIGRAVSEALAREGAIVALADVGELDDAVAAVTAHGTRAVATTVNVTDSRAVRTLVEGAVSAFGGVDVLVCCAGAYGGGTLESVDDDEWSRVLDVNLLGTFVCLREVFPALRARGRGTIVAVGSMAGETGGYLCGPHYAASKGGVHALCKWAAKQGAPDIRVNAVAPGAIATDMIKDEPFPADISPLRRQGQAREVADAVVFLASDASSYITGTVLDVNGGNAIR